MWQAAVDVQRIDSPGDGQQLELEGSRHASIDVMDMLAYRDSFHRFDNFNKKYSPAGQKHLKALFLKHDNDFNGRFLAELTRGMSHRFCSTLSLIELIIL